MPLGVLMLDTRFARFVGDIGNPQSYDEPVLFEVVRGATVDKVVPAKAPPLIEDFVAAGERLIARGATAMTTGCGFLVLNQAELAARLAVPVATSALLLIPALLKLLPAGKRLGVLTFSARDLTPAHFVAAGAPADTPVEGVATGRRVPEGDLRAAVRRQRRGAGGRSRRGGAAAGRAASRHRRDPVRVHQFPAAPRGREGRDRIAGL